MQTGFTLAQLSDPDMAASEKILRACVHCGFCTATCPTYVLRGDELDSPRGRIYLIKAMLEGAGAVDERTVKHIDRCLSCLSCMTTCPSGVHYMHLVDHGRAHIARRHRRPFAERALRSLLALVLPRPWLFRLALIGAGLARPFAALLPGRLKGMVGLAPKTLPGPSPVDRPQVFAAIGARRMRVALLQGCAQQVIAPSINEATIRLLRRHGCEVVVAGGTGCCGALVHHMGKTESSHDAAMRNVAAWSREIERGGLDAIVVNASGCGTTLKDYGYMLRNDKEWATRAARVSAIAKDASEVLATLDLRIAPPSGRLRIAYHAACSLQHGQKITREPKMLLSAAGFEVLDVPEGHLCCGSAGTYNLLQPEIAAALRERKVAAIARTKPDAVAAGNVGCMVQIASGTDIPVVHTVELLDWATGGPKPSALDS
jgi:glycolate oxidase iron-sulfur subunit